MCNCPFSDIRGYYAKKQIELSEKEKDTETKPHKAENKLEYPSGYRKMDVKDSNRLPVCICGSVVFRTESQYGRRFHETDPEERRCGACKPDRL